MLKSRIFTTRDDDGTEAKMTFANIGQRLKSAREAQGLSLRQVYDRTKIPINHLQCIDEGNPEDLPEPVYVSGFIKRYAECVGLDGQLLGEEYRRSLDESNNKKGSRSNKTAVQTMYVPPEYLSRARTRSSAPAYKLWLFNTVILIAVVALITWFLNSQTALMTSQSDPSLASLKEATARLTPGNTETPAVAPLNEQAESTTKLSLIGKRHVWVEIKRVSNGEALFTGYMEQGDKKDFEDSQGLRIRAGDGGGLSVDRRGKIFDFGASGKVVERMFLTETPKTTAPAEESEKPAAVQAAPPVARPVTKRPVTRRADAGSEGGSAPRRLEDGRTRSIPGETGGSGRRSIDVPYRYTEGRLDLD